MEQSEVFAAVVQNLFVLGLTVAVLMVCRLARWL